MRAFIIIIFIRDIEYCEAFTVVNLFIEYILRYCRIFGIIFSCATSLSNIWHHLLMTISDIFISFVAFESWFISTATQLEPISNISTVLLYFLHPVHLLQACVVCTGSVSYFSLKLTPYSLALCQFKIAEARS